MNRLKRLLSLGLCTAMLLTLMACQKDEGQKENNNDQQQEQQNDQDNSSGGSEQEAWHSRPERS